MLPAGSRLRRREDFTDTVRRGRRAGRGGLVVHVYPGPGASDSVPQVVPILRAPLPASSVPPARAGLIVSKAVGGAVVRNRVARRLRHLLVGRVESLEPGTRLVVRALPGAAGESSAALARDLDAALAAAVRGPVRGRSA